MTNQTFVTSEDSPKKVARKQLTDSMLKRTFLWIMAGCILFFLLWAAIVAKAEPTQADHLRNVAEYRTQRDEAIELSNKLGEMMNLEKSKLTGETCAAEKAAGRSENCPQVF